MHADAKVRRRHEDVGRGEASFICRTNHAVAIDEKNANVTNH